MHHQSHLNQYRTKQRNRRAEEEERLERQVRQQERQALRENDRLRRLRNQQQQQQQQQQPQVQVAEEEQEETPPNDVPDVIMPPPRPQKQPGMHRMIIDFNQRAKRQRPKSCSRIEFINAFDNTTNDVNEKDKPPKTDRRRAKSMSDLDLVTISNQEAEFISSAVLQILDQKQADQFVKNQLLKNVNISRITREEISTVVQLHEASSNSDTSRSTTDIDSSFHSIPSEPEQQSLPSPPPVKTPTKTKPPRLPHLRQQRKNLIDKFRVYDHATTLLAQQLRHPSAPKPTTSTTTSAPQSPCGVCDNPRYFTTSPEEREALKCTCPRQVSTAPPRPKSPQTPCVVCDNSRYFLFSPETRKTLKCSCPRQLLTAPPSPQQQQQQQPQQQATPTTRTTRYKGVKQGVWDKASHIFKPSKK